MTHTSAYHGMVQPHPDDAPLPDMLQDILKEPLTFQEILDATGLSNGHASKLINEQMDTGKVVPIAGNPARYALATLTTAIKIGSAK